MTALPAFGALALAASTVEIQSLRLGWGPLVVDVERLRLIDTTARIDGFEAGEAELSGLKVAGPLNLSRLPATDAWRLEPLAAANGDLRAQIVDAHLLFDANVTVPIRNGEVDFGDATVEHVGPDSRMGASELGIYVDAPNGRSYLYRFPSTPVAGVAFERRDALLGQWVSSRGKLHLQAFVEGLLRQGLVAPAAGITDPTRVLFDRTAVSGELRLADGMLIAPGIEAQLSGRAEGRNVLRVQSGAVGRGFVIELPALRIANSRMNAGEMTFAADEVTGELKAQIHVEGGELRFEATAQTLKVAGLRVRRRS
ncbi:hypothetical protein [Ramlibacter sp.]|uniref:hypothetical protein n=1 Tax=Ramlibacter sp. TaxID=1917967 RepID=UPI003D0A4A5D